MFGEVIIPILFSQFPYYLYVCFEKYGLLANGILYTKFQICKVYKTSDNALICDIVGDDW